MGKANSAHSVGPFGINFIHPWLCLESESSMTHTLGLRWANQEQAICLQKMAEGHNEAGYPRYKQGGVSFSFPAQVLQRCLKHHFPNNGHRQGGKQKFSWAQKVVSLFFVFYKSKTGKYSSFSFTPYSCDRSALGNPAAVT